MMRSIHLGLQLPFSTPADQESSEQFLMQLLIFNCVINHRYLLRHPLPLLYDSGVTYAPPAQVAPNRLSPEAIGRVERVLHAEGAEPHLIETIIRLLNGVEEFVDVGELYRRKKGDCNELAPVRVAELWRAGVLASPLLQKAPNPRGGITYHAVVVWPDGTIEDPSMILGMGGRAREAERRAEILKNRERQNTYVDAGAYLIQAEGADERVVAHQIGLLGLLPTSGVFPR